MYKLNVISHFSSAHKLEGYDGQCKNLHGHNWKVRVAVQCEKTDKIGLAIDFGVIKNYLKEIIDKLDHQYLNNLEFFKDMNPTSENIAKLIYEEFSKKINDDNCRTSEVEIWESEKSSVIYTDDRNKFQGTRNK